MAMTVDKEDRDVRVAAVNALGSVAKFGQVGQQLFNIFGNLRDDPLVRDAAWNTFKKLLPTAEERVLYDWIAGPFKDSPGYKAVMYQALADKQETAGKLKDLASTEQSLGEELMNTSKPEQAAKSFQKALDYWLSTGSPPTTLIALMTSREKALLAAHQYAEAAKFLQEMVARDRAVQSQVGAPLVNEADRLVNQAPHDYKSGRDLAIEGLKLPDGVLPQRFHDRLLEYKNTAEEELRKAKPSPPR